MSSIPISVNQSMLYSSNIRRQLIPEKERSLNVKAIAGRVTRASLNVEVKSPDIIEKKLACLKRSKKVEAAAKVLVGTYARPPIVLAHDKGCKLYDLEGQVYLDMASRIAVNALEHSDLDLVKAAADQANTLTHVSNIYHSTPEVTILDFLDQ